MRVCDFCEKDEPEKYLSFQDLEKKHLPQSPYEICKRCFVQVEGFAKRLKGCKGTIIEVMERERQ